MHAVKALVLGVFKLHPHEPIFPRHIHPCHIFVKSKLCQFEGKFSRCLKMEENRDFRFSMPLISIFRAALKENANQPANFSGLILPEKWTNSSQNVIVFGSCGRGLINKSAAHFDIWNKKQKFILNH